MEKLGSYSYPSHVSFKEVLELTKRAQEKFGGTIPNRDAAPLLGYTVHQGSSLSGTLYDKFDDAEMFGLIKKTGKTLTVTSLGKQAVGSLNSMESDAAKAQAVRNVEIIGKSYDQWNGEIPDAAAMPAKLVGITAENYESCARHVNRLKKVFAETFPYIAKARDMGIAGIPQEALDGEGSEMSPNLPLITEKTNEGQKRVLGQLKTNSGYVVITDLPTLNVAFNFLEALKAQLTSNNNDVHAKLGQAE